MEQRHKPLGNPVASHRWGALTMSVLVPCLLLLSVLVLTRSATAGTSYANITGIVADPDGTPFTNMVAVNLYEPDAPGDEASWQDWVNTNGTGTFVYSLANVPGRLFPGDLYLQAEAPSGSPYYRSVPQLAHLVDVNTPVDAGLLKFTYASFAGVVYRPDGALRASGGQVDFRVQYDGAWRLRAWGGYDAEGYAVGGVPAANGVLIARPPENSTFWSSLPVSVSVAAGTQYVLTATQFISLQLQYPNLTGHVRYPEGSAVTWITNGTEILGRGLARVIDQLDYQEQWRPGTSWGEFGFLVVGGRDYEVWVEPEGTLAVTYTRSIPLIVHASPTETVHTGGLSLTYPSFSGWLHEPDGSVYTGCANVWLEGVSMGTQGTCVVYCGSTGRPYQLGGVPAGDYLLHADPDAAWGFLSAPAVPVHVAPGSQYLPGATQSVSLTLAQPHLAAFVTDDEGNPIDAIVRVWDGAGYKDEQASGVSWAALFDGLQPGRAYRVQAWPISADIPRLANSMVREYVIPHAGTLSVTLALQLPDVVGVVVAPEGGELPPAYEESQRTRPAAVQIYNADRSTELWGLTSITGAFGLAMGDDEYTLVAFPHASLVNSYTHSIPQPFSTVVEGPGTLSLDPVRLTYPRLRGTVRNPAGQLVSGGVHVWNADGSYYDYDGTFYDGVRDWPFRLGGMPAGTYFAQARRSDGTPGMYGPSDVYGFTVIEGSQYQPTATQEVTFTLSALNFTGQLRYPAWWTSCPYCPVEGADVRASTSTTSAPQWATTDETGHFYYTGLAIGTYTLDFFLGDDLLVNWAPPASPVTFTLSSPDQTVTGTYTLQPAAHNKHVVGQVVYESGMPVDGAQVYAHQDGSGQQAGTVSDFDGRYTLDLTGGRWKLGVAPASATSAVDWYFDPSWEQWVSFSLDPTLPETQTLVFTVTRTTYYAITGRVEVTTTGAPPPADSTWVALCTDEGHCFDSPVAPSGAFTVTALPGPYRAWFWVDPATGLLPPAENGAAFTVVGDDDVGVLYLRSQSDRTARVSGRLLFPTGGEGTGFHVGAWSDAWDWATTEALADGSYSLDLLPGHWYAGPLLTDVQRDGYFLWPEWQDGVLGAGETASDVNFSLYSRNAVLKGEVVVAGRVLTDVNAVVFALYCADAEAGECLMVDQKPVQGGSFELRLVGGVTYTVGIWLPSGGYVPGPNVPVEQYLGAGQAVTGVQLELLEAGTRIHGYLLDGGGNPVILPAYVYAASSNGQYWVEDTLWPGKDPYEYSLSVPTVNSTVTWTLGLWVDPGSGYIADPAYPVYQVVVGPGETDVEQLLRVLSLDVSIGGTVTVDGAAVSYAHVYARGAGSANRGLYFEAQTDASGVFTMPVLGGTYVVGAYPPPELAGTHLPPQPVRWSSAADNPVQLAFRPKPPAGQALEIAGSLFVSPPGALAGSTPIRVFGSSTRGSVQVTGTLDGGYRLPVISNTVWTVWAAYDAPNSNAYYVSGVRTVRVGSTSVSGADLALVRATFGLPDARCWTFDAARYTRLSLPPRGDLPAPLLEVPAGAFPVTGTVKVCATPMVALPDGHNTLGFAYELEAWDSRGNLITQNFNKKLRLTYYLNENAIPAGADPATLQPAYYSSVRQEWVPLEDAFVDAEDLFVTGKIDHFSRWRVSFVPGASCELYLPLVARDWGS